ncbi:MAG: NUDIX domain-containing protein [Actinomycetota bacterium]|nr:NUDIX domain-containing protein [Actinomycetota bacterium]
MTAELECRAHSLIADVALMANDSVLMVGYTDVEQYDGETGWFLPNDEMQRLEHPGLAALRIAREQLGLELKPARLGVIESFQGNSGTWHLSFHYVAELPSIPDITTSHLIETAQWFPLAKLPPRPEVAHHGWALTILEKIRRSSDSGTFTQS